MAARSREWLQTFLDLGAFTNGSVSKTDVERQEDTVLRALELLDTQPGVVLADEVGMGKTYEALGVIATRMTINERARTLILTPGPSLTEKWVEEIRSFGDRTRPVFRGFEGRWAEAKNLGALIDALRGEKVLVVAPVNVFAVGRPRTDRAYLLAAWAEERGLAGNQISALFNRYDADVRRVTPTDQLFLAKIDHAAMKTALRNALRAHRKAGKGSLDAIFDAGYAAFENKSAVDAALMDIRFRVLGELVPHLDLLVVDEAHKLKNADSVRATAVRTIFDKRFDKALFLTATPFQLSIDELAQIFAIFGFAKSAPPDMDARADALLASVREYTRAYEAFESVWRRLDGAGAADFAAWFEGDPELATVPDDPSLRAVVAHAKRLVTLKRAQIEPGFRAWMIRSLRPHKREYRRSTRVPITPRGGAAVPFLLYERFIAELFRSGRQTHKAAVQINMVSSYGAAREGALLKTDDREGFSESAEAYRKLVQRIVREVGDARGGHPKLEHVVNDAIEAAERGEKTLIFCARIETLHELKHEIEARWNERMLASWRKVHPSAELHDVTEEDAEDELLRGRHAKLRTRFQRGQDALYLALRERYVATLLDACAFAHAHIEDIVERANTILARQRLTKAHAERIDWSVAKRCVEQATAVALVEAGLATEIDAEALRRLTDPSFVALGLDLIADELESDATGAFAPEWRIHVDDARTIVGQTHLWKYLTSQLVEVPADLRVRIVERLARYLASTYVPFLPELLVYARSEGLDVENIEARALLAMVDRFWTTPTGRPWCDLIRAFLTYAMAQPEARRRDIVGESIKAGRIVRETTHVENRAQLREAFNTPLYPMILVANEVMQEGLDLHHNCRRVVHHDLVWNPAQLEQRVGRVDRLGSLVQRMRARAPETKLEIGLPLIVNTIDERLERTVRLRERWLEFLLGASPKIEEYGLSDDVMQPLPAAFADALRVELGP